MRVFWYEIFFKRKKPGQVRDTEMEKVDNWYQMVKLYFFFSFKLKHKYDK